jgi:NADH-quinone oxidoreductase subunit H
MSYLGYDGAVGALLYVVVQIALSLAVILPLLVVIAYLLLMDRKVWAAVQLRRGPNVVGPFGLLQSFADLLKFAVKEPLIPAGADKTVFLLAPLATATCALAAWAVIPVDETGWGRWVIADLNVGILYLLAISSLGVYGVIMGGWASNSKYAFMGSLRSCAQMVSYEVSIGLVIITVLLCAGSLNMTDIVNAQRTGLGTQAGLPASALDWYWLPLFPMFVVFFISALAETNRPPFDLPEAESELVAGFMVEYASTPYLLFMLGEYVAITTMCALMTILFLGGWLPPVNHPAVTWVPGIVRPTYAARLEGVPAAVAGHGGRCRRRAPVRHGGAVEGGCRADQHPRLRATDDGGRLHPATGRGPGRVVRRTRRVGFGDQT